MSDKLLVSLINRSSIEHRQNEGKRVSTKYSCTVDIQDLSAFVLCKLYKGCLLLLYREF